MNGPGTEGEAGRRPIYSIGAVAKMLGLETAALRSWEDRYRLVVPERSSGAQRIYSRNQLEQLRFVVDTMRAGATPADAHRMLADRLRGENTFRRMESTSVTLGILLAERDRYAAELCEYFLRTEGYDVWVALDPALAERLFDERQPDLSIVELMMSGGGLDLCRRLAEARDAPVLAVSTLDLAQQALAAGASAFLAKPFLPLQFVSTVRDLLGSSALTRHESPVGS